MIELASNQALLEELASKSGGKVFSAENATELVDLLTHRAVTREHRTERKSWQEWWTLLVFLLLLSAEWVGRKLAGLGPVDRTFAPVLSAPLFPSYLSGHSTYSAAAAQVLGAVFPADSARLQAMAEEAGISRIYAGIHFPSDNRAGLALGAAIGRLVIAAAPPAAA